MTHLSSGILGGIAALLVISPFIPDLRRPLEAALMTLPVDHRSVAGYETARSVNRALKGDRLPPARAREPQRSISSVEVVGLGNVAVVYRDREGNILFRTDPLTNVTIVTAGVTLPKVTIRDSDHAPPKRLPLERAVAPQPGSAMPVGCEPAISTMSDRALARIPARCVSSIEAGSKVALALR
jgi:hypothetical protein